MADPVNPAVQPAPDPTPPAPTLKISPNSVELSANDVQAFAVEPPGLLVNWEIQPRVGEIDKRGVYLAPSIKDIPNTRTVVVVAQTPGGAQYGTASIMLSDAPRKISLLGLYGIALALLIGTGVLVFWSLLSTPAREAMVVVNPPVITLDPKVSETVQFTATVLGDAKNAVVWSAPSGKSIDPNGLYHHTADPSATKAMSFAIRATSVSDQSRFSTVTVNLVPGQHLEIMPQGSSAFTSQQIPFRAEGTDKANVTWSLSRNDLGVISPTDGTYTVGGGILRQEPVQIVAKSNTTPLVYAAAAVIVTPPFATTSFADWRMLFFVMVMGSLGSMIYFSSSFVSYVGNRTFHSSWFWFYISRPFVGGALAVIFFFLVGSGLVDGTTAPQLMKVALIAALVGLFSDKAVKKLSDVLDVLLATKDDRKDKLPETKPQTAGSAATVPQGALQPGTVPKINSANPVSVKQGQAATVTLSGTNINNAQVKINNGPTMTPKAQSHDSVTIDLKVEDTKGDKVTIQVINGDKTNASFDLMTTP